MSGDRFPVRTLILAALMLASACTTAAPAPDRSPLADIPEARRTMISTPVHTNVPIWYIRPEGAPADARVVFVMHGVQRDADRYLREWSDLARRYGFVVIVPEFTKAAFPGADAYNLGDTHTKAGQEKPRSAWSYAVIEAAFEAIRSAEGLTADGYVLYGHSAGAQFVHRFVLLGEGPRMQQAIAANAGWYAFPDRRVDWPYGLRNAPAGADPLSALKAPLTVLLGDADTDPDHSSLRRTPEANDQGPHRFARGQAFYASARTLASDAAVPLAWRCALAPGLGHDNGVAAKFAVALITTQTSLPEAGSPCRTISPVN